MELSWYEQAVLKVLRELYSYNRYFVQTRIVAGFIAKNDRMVRGVLVRLECKQAVVRKGQRGGWKPIDRRAKPAGPLPSFFTVPKLEGWKPPTQQAKPAGPLPSFFAAPKLEGWKPPAQHPKPMQTAGRLKEYHAAYQVVN